MHQVSKPHDLIDQLSSFEVFEDVERKDLQWLINSSDYVLYEIGDDIFYPGMEVEYMQIIVQGKYEVVFEQEGKSQIIGEFGKENITGILPFSRMKSTTARGKIIEETYALRFHKDGFIDMVNQSYFLTQQLVGQMSDRIRNFSHLRYQREKLMSLGKISAGLAHELNNPASAMVRSAEELYRHIHTTPERFKDIITMRITPEQTDDVNRILFSKISNYQAEKLNLMEREERFDDIIDWLEENGMDNADDIADTFTEFDFNTTDLDEIKSYIPKEATQSIMWWLQSTLDLEKLVGEIKESSDRISELVQSIKNYSHMDRDVDVDFIDIHDGIINTMVMLKHKLKKKNIQLVKELQIDLPKIKAFPGQLNQVWTNLMDNAIDAMEHNGTLKIRTEIRSSFIDVSIIDNGPGIPQDIQDKIFDPFYTTKGIGEGTGLGLDTVRRIIDHHEGMITVSSEPGKTIFRISLPLSNE